MKFVGCKKAKEISLTKTPAVERATVLVTKNQGNQSENDDMDFKIIQRMASMSEATKSYLAGLDTEEAVKAFLAKPVDEQDKEAADAKKAIDDAAAARTRAEEATKAVTGETAEALKAANDRIAELEKAQKDAATEREIEKMAGSADFHGFPGGEVEVTKNLKLAYAAGGETKTALIESMKAQAKLAKTMGSTEFGSRSEHEFTKNSPATAEIEKTAQKMVDDKEAKSIPDAIAAMSEMRKHADLFARADRERTQAAAA